MNRYVAQVRSAGTARIVITRTVRAIRMHIVDIQYLPSSIACLCISQTEAQSVLALRSSTSAAPLRTITQSRMKVKLNTEPIRKSQRILNINAEKIFKESLVQSKINLKQKLKKTKINPNQLKVYEKESGNKMKEAKTFETKVKKKKQQIRKTPKNLKDKKSDAAVTTESGEKHEESVLPVKKEDKLNLSAKIILNRCDPSKNSENPDNDNVMAVKKHELVTNNSTPLDLKALAQCIKLMNDQAGYLPPTPELVKNCQDIVKCLARSPGNEEGRGVMLQTIEEFLLRVMNTVDQQARSAIVNGVMDKFYAYISDPQSDANSATSIVLVVLNTASVESLMPMAHWVVEQGKNSPAGAGLRASLSCLYSWLCEHQGQWQGTPVLGDWVMAFIKALEEDECFDLLTDVSVDNLDRLFSVMDKPATLRQPIADVIFHVLASLRQSTEAFDKVSHHVDRVLTNLASDSGQFSRQLLQNVVDILTATVDQLAKKIKGTARFAFKDKYGVVILCLERHMASRGCELLKTPAWPARKACPPRELVASDPPEPEAHKIGLLNLGNTCYMNSVMQALLLTRRFSTHVMMNMTNHPYWAIAAMLFGRLVHSVSTKLDSREFFKIMRPPFFTSNNQHDSSEFLGYFFELLQSFEHVSDENFDYAKPPVLSTANLWKTATQSYPVTSSDSEAAGSDPNRRSVSPRPGGSGGGSSSSGSKRQNPSDVDNQVVKKRARYEQNNLRRDCYIDSVFGGVLLTRVECIKCQSTSLSRDVFRDLQLAFPEKPVAGLQNVQSLLDFYCSKERLTGDNRYSCRDCGTLQDAERSVLIENIPNHLILVLKHFKFDPKLQVQSKLIHKVYYNYTLNVPVVRAHATHATYKLYAAVVHSGSTLDSGHYFTLAEDKGTWHKYNDDEVINAPASMINELEKYSTPYLLFYRRDDVVEEPFPALEDLPAKIQEHVLAHNKHYVDSLRP